MSTIQLAAEAVRRFTEPTRNFTWGTRIYEPEPQDHSHQADMKREVILSGARALAWAEHRATSIATRTNELIDLRIKSRLEAVLRDDPEQRDFAQYAAAIERLVATFDAEA